jgi:hypothetical protein
MKVKPSPADVDEPAGRRPGIQRLRQRRCAQSEHQEQGSDGRLVSRF